MADTTCSRRDFFLAAGGVLGTGLATAPADAQWLRRRRRPCPCPCSDPQPGTECNRIRQNIISLSPTQVESFKQGVTAMKALPATDPRSWSFQANIHGVPGPATNPLFKQCEHGTLQFLTWHRGYLYYFERILRWASGDPALTLPYWNWTTHPALPEIFRLPASTSNPLFETRWINDGSSLPTNVVDTDLTNALANLAFPESGPTGFSRSLEGSPHGAVHVLVGGKMGSVPTAANDPIFWLHHCNIDRIWDQWLGLGGGRSNPTDPVFLDKTYSFADETGATVTVKVRDIISGCGLGYRYDDVPPTRANAQVVSRMQGQKTVTTDQPAQVAASSVAEEKRATPVGQLESKPLGFKTETVKLTAVPALAESLKGRPAALAQGTRSKVFVDIEGINLAEVPNFTYAVYLNLPDGATDEQKKTHYLGTINFFDRDGKGGHDHTTSAAEKTFTESFELDGAIARLARTDKWSAENLTVSLVPVTTVPPAGTPDNRAALLEASAQKANMSYKRVNIRITPDR